MNTLQRRLVAAALAALVSWPARAELVPVEWDAAGTFVKETAISSGKFVEVCEKLPSGAQVRWRFSAGSPLDFNIHYHQGKEVRFPAKHKGVAQLSGVLDVAVPQDYCWMWTNKGATPATLKLQLQRR
jgi:hypothetical protein